LEIKHLYNMPKKIPDELKTLCETRADQMCPKCAKELNICPKCKEPLGGD